MTPDLIAAAQAALTCLPDPDDILFHIRFEVSKHIVKKNSRNIFYNRKTGRMFPGKDKELTASERMLQMALQSRKNQIGLHEPIKHRLWIMMHFYFPKTHYFTKAGTINKTIPDLSNLYEFPQDCLTKAGVIEDDTLIDSHDGSRRLPWDREEYVLEIFLMRYANGSAGN